MPNTAILAQRHAKTRAPYNANTFAEQNKALVGLSRRLRGFGFVSIVLGTSITVGRGYFVSAGLVINPAFPDRTAGIIAETISNSVLDISGLNADFYIFALANDTVEGAGVIFTTANSPVPPSTQHAAIARYVAGQYLLEEALGDDGVEAQVQTARLESGADQFLLSVDPNTAPATTATLSAANLPDDTVLGPTAVVGLAIPGTNYVWFDAGLGAVQSGAVGFPADVTSLWELALDGSGLVTSLIDRRPWFSGGGSGGDAGAIEERLKEILQHSVMQNARISALPADAAPDIDTGASSGTFLGPSEYSLADTEQLVSDFSSAALEAPASVDQVTVAVLVDQLLDPGDIQIEVSRDGGANYETVADNFTNHVFGAVPAGNNLQLKITNVAGGPDPIVIRGYGMYYNNIGGPTGLLGAGPGILIDGSGLNITGMKPNPTWLHSDLPVTFTWTTAGGGVLGWTGDFRFGFWNGSGGYFSNRVTLASSPLGPPIADGDFVYADLNPLVDDAVVTLVVSPGGPPVALPGRVIFGVRRGTLFLMQGERTLEDDTLFPGKTGSVLQPLGMDLNRWQALLAAVGPTGANRFITAAELPGAAPAAVKIFSITAIPAFFVSSPAVPLGTANFVMLTFHTAGRTEASHSLYVTPSNALYDPLFYPVGVIVSGFLNTTLVWNNIAPRIWIQRSGTNLFFSSDSGGTVHALGW